MQSMGTHMKYDTLLNQLNQVSRQLVIKHWNQSHKSMSMQTINWNVDDAADAVAISDTVFLICTVEAFIQLPNSMH